MHISEGALGLPLLASSGAFVAMGTTLGLKRLDYDKIMTAALLSAAFVVASLVHVPIGPGSMHLMLNGLLGMILGIGAIPAIVVALILQTLLFQHGGISVLGINALIMAGPAVIVYFLFGSLVRKGGKTGMVGGFLGGFSAVLLSSLIMAGSLIASNLSFSTTARILVGANLPVMVIEGFITMFAVSFLLKVQPDLLRRKVVLPPK